MKRLLLVPILLFANFSILHAQKNNIEIGITNYKFSNVLNQPEFPFNNGYNIKYTRNISNHLNSYINYIFTPTNSSIFISTEQIMFSTESVGKLIGRKAYHYFDLGASYNLFKYKKHTFSTYAGLSIAYGKNEYLSYIEMSKSKSNYEIWIGRRENQEVMEAYFGGVIGLKYDYLFWKDRLNIGVNFGARKYLNKNNAHLEIQDPNLQHIDPNIPGGRHDFPFQINYGIHLGFNF